MKKLAFFLWTTQIVPPPTPQEKTNARAPETWKPLSYASTARSWSLRGKGFVSWAVSYTHLTLPTICSV
eukprot:3747208-Rhodomonas_salina.1